MRERVTAVILFACCFMFVSCNNQEADIKTVENNKSEIIEEAKDAYIFARNFAIWTSVLDGSKGFNEVIGKEIQQPEELKIYRQENLDENPEEERYYFMGTGAGSTLRYSKNRKKWSTMMGLAYKEDIDELLSNDGVEFIGTVNIIYPKAYLPEPNLTDHKKSCLEVIQNFIKEYLEKYVKEGEYRITVMDFSEADDYTEVMIQNDKGENSVLPVTIVEDKESEAHIEVRSNGIRPDFKEEFDLGGIKYSELFSKLSVESYNVSV